MSLNVNAVMDGLGVRLATISGLRVFDFPPDSASPPFAVVAMPEEITYDSTMKRGGDEMVVAVHVVVGKVSDRSARDQLGVYMAGTGATSVKTVIEADRTLGGAADSCRVTSAVFSTFDMAAQPFLAGTLNVHVIG